MRVCGILSTCLSIERITAIRRILAFDRFLCQADYDVNMILAKTARFTIENIQGDLIRNPKPIFCILRTVSVK